MLTDSTGQISTPQQHIWLEATVLYSTAVVGPLFDDKLLSNSSLQDPWDNSALRHALKTVADQKHVKEYYNMLSYTIFHGTHKFTFNFIAEWNKFVY